MLLVPLYLAGGLKPSPDTFCLYLELRGDIGEQSQRIFSIKHPDPTRLSDSHPPNRPNKVNVIRFAWHRTQEHPCPC